MANKIIAQTEAEWWTLMRKELAKWNNNNHPEDNLSLLDFVGEHVGGSPIFGYKVERDDYGMTESGYRLRPMEGQEEEEEDEDEWMYH